MDLISCHQVEELDFGSEPPYVELTNMTDPLPEFYQDLDSDGNSYFDEFDDDGEDDSVQVDDSISLVHENKLRRERASTMEGHQKNMLLTDTLEGLDPDSPISRTLPRSDDSLIDDVQLELALQYHGNLRMTISTELIINHPTSQFLILPVRMTLTAFSLDGKILCDRVPRGLAYDARQKPLSWWHTLEGTL